MAFPRVTEIAHLLVASRLRLGDHTIDATVGNGHDTLFLARAVGAEGKVDGFDVQEAAITSTGHKVAGLDQVRLHLLGHEKMGQVVTTPVMAIMFNLGYLPSGDTRLITRPETTVIAMKAALDLLLPHGIITVIVYPGHEGGRIEADEVESLFRGLDPLHFHTLHHGPLSDSSRTDVPYLLAAERRR